MGVAEADRVTHIWPVTWRVSHPASSIANKDRCAWAERLASDRSRVPSRSQT